MNQTVQALCARCRVPLERVAEPNLDNRFTCPGCGNGDTYDAIMGEVGDYIAAVTLQTIGDAEAVTDRQWRFVAEVKF